MPELTVSNVQVYDAIEGFPRNELDPVLYTHDLPSHRPLLPRLEGNENSLVQIRIPSRYLNSARNQNVAKRKIWGTDIYTDDSDIVAVLYHTGHLTLLEDGKTEKRPEPLKNNRGIKPEFGELHIDEPRSQPLIIITEEDQESSGFNDAGVNPINPAPVKQKQVPSFEYGDCIVTILILPCLEKYQGSYRNGIYSRSWLTKHDGVSFSIYDIKLVAEGEAESMFAAKKRRLNSSSMSPEIPVFNEGTPFSTQLEPGPCPNFDETEETDVDSPSSQNIY